MNLASMNARWLVKGTVGVPLPVGSMGSIDSIGYSTLRAMSTDEALRKALAQPGLALADRSHSGSAASLAFGREGSEVGPEADFHVR